MTRSPGPLLLLPPSEGKAEGGRPGKVAARFESRLASARVEVATELRRLLSSADRGQLERVLRVRGALLDRAVQANGALADPSAPLLAAWRRYSGVVWSSLDPASIPAPLRRQILVPSALYGITTGTDKICDYRLTMHASLPATGKLAAWWQPRLTELLVAHAKGRFLVDLLPSEHAAAIDFDALDGPCRLLRVRFVAKDGSGAAGHAAKAVKGTLARALLLSGEAALEGFRWEGWRSKASDEGFEIRAPH